MNDFLKAVQTGLSRAQAAHDANAQIDAVLAEFATGILQATGGKVRVGIGRTSMNAIANMLSSRPAVESILLDNGQEKVAVATIGRSPEGFPITIAHGSKSSTAVGVDSLKTVLSALLEDVETGRAILCLADSNVAAASPASPLSKSKPSPRPQRLPAPPRRTFAAGGAETRTGSDSLSTRAPLDVNRINLQEDWEVAYWVKKLGVTEARLRTAVARWGTSADEVEKQLKRAKGRSS